MLIGADVALPPQGRAVRRTSSRPRGDPAMPIERRRRWCRRCDDATIQSRHTFDTPRRLPWRVLSLLVRAANALLCRWECEACRFHIREGEIE